MPEVTQIEVKGKIYDIRDATARQRTIPSGGTTGQFLKKNSGTSYDASWADVVIPEYSAAKENIGSASAGTAIAADDITSWNAGTLPAATVDAENEMLVLSDGILPSLGYTARTIPNISVTQKSVVTGISAN